MILKKNSSPEGDLPIFC